MKCVFCNKDAGEHGNNALPIIDGRCCDICNGRIVIPFRIKSHYLINKMQNEISNLKRKLTEK